jgi:hypothetical protein
MYTHLLLHERFDHDMMCYLMLVMILHRRMMYSVLMYMHLLQYENFHHGML